MGNHHAHLTQADRISIPALLQAKLNGLAIARKVHDSRYTIHRKTNRSQARPTARAWVQPRPVVTGAQWRIAALFALTGVAPPSRIIRVCKSRAAACAAHRLRSASRRAAAAGAAP